MLSVDDHIADHIGLILGRGDESVPVIDDDIDGMDPGIVEDPVLVADHLGRRLDTQRLAVHKQDRQHQGQGQGSGTDPVDPFMRTHGITPCSRRYS